MSLTLFTIGHSTHPIERFLELLREHQIEALADIRRFPGSRKLPQFNSENLAKALASVEIEYRWFEDLGGRRKQSEAPGNNLGLRNQSFRNYADYMLTEAFQQAIEQLLDLAEIKRTAYMCAEGLFWQCHRRLVSDFLLAKGLNIQHIMPNGELQPHALTKEARVRKGILMYPEAGTDRERRLFE